ncbi:DUF969 domain-containing protein [Streptococcus iniae]|uniref:DUF969 domain-containing protein n=1 Tax=Streptococcus iniae TaxID=1346 RepID=UPI0003347FED|nr:DUF969 domain-containing protein [Streptococcus iniae]AGM99216.1 hypothetical protein K710_1455 [Streptococcus iniae SF1]APD32188.1 hypothetical protein BMF34_06800 [Streptococcus iniae]ASL35141.1 permease [Streptococcus iniae]AYB01291.1 DUF969 domain-containing protein [Streptococcus iniae]AYB03155.1 DUF969 domain-containing protein [Streptococcus iniae]
MEWIKLIGIAIIVLGFILKFDTIATVVIAGLVTALVSGISFLDFLEILGKEFTNQRVLTIFFVTLPLIGLSETFGLKHRATQLIQGIQSFTVGRFFTLYLIIREIAGFFSIRLGGHPQFVRPLIHPMGEAAAVAKAGDKLTDKQKDDIKAMAAANENFGNFFAQNTFVGAGGVLLIGGTLDQLGYDGNTAKIASASIIIAVITIFIVGIYNYLFEKKLEKFHKKGDK